ncbi:hypothetical protein MTO96_000494 [Rhipicephalus appendiculatus]
MLAMADRGKTLEKHRSTFELRPLVQAAIRPSNLGCPALKETPLQRLAHTRDDYRRCMESNATVSVAAVEPRAVNVHVLDNRVNAIVIGLVEDRRVPSQ